MAILVSEDTRLVVQGITGREGTFHTLRNRDYGTQVVAGVTPGKGGSDVDGIPVFDTVADAVRETGANTAMVFVPPRFAADAIYESADAGVELVVCIAEGIPAHEMLDVYTYLRPRGIRLLGPNCPGALSPGRANVGIIPAQVFAQGGVGLVLALRHAHVPDRCGAGTARPRQLHHRRHRRRPGRRHELRRRAPAVPGRRPDRDHRDGRRDRRERGGEGGRLHRRARHQAGVLATSPASPRRPARRWATPARSSPARRAPRRRKKEALEARGVKVGTNPTEVAQLVAAGVRG